MRRVNINPLIYLTSFSFLFDIARAELKFVVYLRTRARAGAQVEQSFDMSPPWGVKWMFLIIPTTKTRRLRITFDFSISAALEKCSSRHFLWKLRWDETWNSQRMSQFLAFCSLEKGCFLKDELDRKFGKFSFECFPIIFLEKFY